MSKNWGVFDCETDSFDGQSVKPFIFGFLRDGIYEHFYDVNKFIEAVENFDGILYAHNGGKFDVLMLSEFFDLNQPVKIINGRLAEVKIGQATLRDSMMLLPVSLKSSGEKIDFDYEILNRNKTHLRTKHKAEIEAYLKQDCVALKNMLDHFFDFFGDGHFSLAGACLKKWEGMGGEKRRSTWAHDAALRPFYYGGRVQAFQTGALGDGWDYYDIKSAYPSAMCDELPAGDISEYKITTTLKSIQGRSFCEIRAISHGALPWRTDLGLQFPNDNTPRDYFCTGHELLAGLVKNCVQILEIKKILTSTTTESLKPYVDFFYAQKNHYEKIGDKMNRELSKFAMNSLSGKFGQNPDGFKNYFLVSPGSKKENYSTNAEFAHFDIVEKDAHGAFFDVALVASVTGAVRAKLFENFFNVKNLAYCDTDSIICKGAKNIDVGKNLGQWEKECTLDNLHIAGKKLYTGYDRAKKDWKVAHKGFSRLDTGYQDIIAAATGAVLTIEKSAPNIKLSGAQKFFSRTMKKTG